MASSSIQVIAPKVNDARGLLIPDDIVLHREYIKSNPTSFWSSYQFYLKAGKTRDEVIDPETILKYLSAIPDRHFRLIGSICLDLGINSPLLLKDCDLEVYFKRLIGNILDRGNGELVIKLLMTYTVTYPREFNEASKFQDKWTEVGDCPRHRRLYSKLQDYFGCGDRIQWGTVKKEKYDLGHSVNTYAMLDRTSDGTLSDSSDGTLCALAPDVEAFMEAHEKRLREEFIYIDGMCFHNPSLPNDDEDYPEAPWQVEEEDYEKIFKIDPISGEFSLWKKMAIKPNLSPRAVLKQPMMGLSLMWDPIRGHHY